MSTNGNNLSLMCQLWQGRGGKIKGLKSCIWHVNLCQYCSNDCQKAHHSKHKKECTKRAAELHDEALFTQPPQKEEDCLICLLPMPSLLTGRRYTMHAVGKRCAVDATFIHVGAMTSGINIVCVPFAELHILLCWRMQYKWS